MPFVERTLPRVRSHACALWVGFPGTIYMLQLLAESGCEGAPLFDMDNDKGKQTGEVASSTATSVVVRPSTKPARGDMNKETMRLVDLSLQKGGTSSIVD